MKKFNFLTNQLGHESYEGRKRVQAVGVSLPSFCRVNMLKLVSVLVILLTLGVGNAWGDKLTITSANVQTGSYPTSEATFTLASTYTFGYLNCYNPNQNNTPSGWRAGQTIQCKKDASAYGRMYNKTSITGMTKLRFWIITPNPPTLSVYTGTSMISSTPGSGAISLPNPASGSESVTYATASKSGKTWTYGTGSVTISYYDVDVPTGNTYFYFTIGNTTTTQLYQLEIFYSSGTTVSLTNGGCDGSGGTSKGSFLLTTKIHPDLFDLFKNLHDQVDQVTNFLKFLHREK